jgi:antitoxin VapB
MALSIKSDQADQLARELARTTGESITEAVTEAIRQRLSRVTGGRTGIAAQLEQIAEQGRNLPRLDDRAESEILGYDNAGLPQ